MTAVSPVPVHPDPILNPASNVEGVGVSRAMSYFNAVLAAFEAAARVCEHTHHVRMMDSVFRIRFAGDAVERLIFPALAHLRIDPSGSPDDDPFTICVWDSAAMGIPLPSIPWEFSPDRCTLDYGTQGEIRGYNDARFGALHHQWYEQITLIDRERQIGIVWFGDAEGQPYWERAFPLRPLLHLWSRDTDAQLLHAAAVGTPNGGALLIGVSGAGKSSTALACVRAPEDGADDTTHSLRLAGDDYTAVRVPSDGMPTVYSLYNVVKLNADNLPRFPYMTHWIDNPDQLDREKAMISLYEHAPESLIEAFPLKAILLPTITGAERSQILPVAPFEALFAVAPTTVFQLIAAKQRTLAKLAGLVRRVPVYRLALGTDRREIARTLGAFLETQ